ncbi:hypothetical protein C1645_817535 [Glomus cerebriforme]|uniref:Uncharacterized protein n=1 Tax=Glomus cerebriforme TaxID=658196 RepID=A0A397T9B0_9GLOM|nr:hypothetical protein C1645_817535 [Glomus cerebriforme]
MPYKLTRGARGVVHARGLRRKEEVLNSSHQSTSTTLQPSSTQQSSSQQSAISPIIIDPEIITSRPHTSITSPTPTERQ